MQKHGVQMVYQMNNDIIKKIDALITNIKESSEYKNYVSLTNKISNNEDINSLVNEIKQIEKDLVRRPSILKEEELKQKEKELNSIPIYLDYKESCDTLNNMLLIIKNRMDKFVKELIIEE